MHRNQSIDLQSKLMNWFIYDTDLCHERVNDLHLGICFLKVIEILIIFLRHNKFMHHISKYSINPLCYFGERRFYNELSWTTDVCLEPTQVGCKQISNHSASFAKWLSICLKTKTLLVQSPISVTLNSRNFYCFE